MVIVIDKDWVYISNAQVDSGRTVTQSRLHLH